MAKRIGEKVFPLLQATCDHEPYTVQIQNVLHLKMCLAWTGSHFILVSKGLDVTGVSWVSGLRQTLEICTPGCQRWVLKTWVERTEDEQTVALKMDLKMASNVTRAEKNDEWTLPEARSREKSHTFQGHCAFFGCEKGQWLKKSLQFSGNLVKRCLWVFECLINGWVDGWMDVLIDAWMIDNDLCKCIYLFLYLFICVCVSLIDWVKFLFCAGYLCWSTSQRGAMSFAQDVPWVLFLGIFSAPFDSFKSLLSRCSTSVSFCPFDTVVIRLLLAGGDPVRLFVSSCCCVSLSCRLLLLWPLGLCPSSQDSSLAIFLDIDGVLRKSEIWVFCLLYMQQLWRTGKNIFKKMIEKDNKNRTKARRKETRASWGECSTRHTVTCMV